MPQQAWSAKRERQYEHIEEVLEERGTPKKKAKEIAARTVNKERARKRRGEDGVQELDAGHLVGPPRRAFARARIARKAARRSSSTTRRSGWGSKAARGCRRSSSSGRSTAASRRRITRCPLGTVRGHEPLEARSRRLLGRRPRRRSRTSSRRTSACMSSTAPTGSRCSARMRVAGRSRSSTPRARANAER